MAFDDAARFLSLALDALRRCGFSDAERAELLVELASVTYRAGQVSDSLDCCVAAADAAERAGRPDLLAAAALVVQGVGAPATAAGLTRLCTRALVAGADLPPPSGSGYWPSRPPPMASWI